LVYSVCFFFSFFRFNAGTARALKLTGVVGLAAVEALGG